MVGNDCRGRYKKSSGRSEEETGVRGDRKLSGAETNGLGLDGYVQFEHGSYSCLKTCCGDDELNCVKPGFITTAFVSR